MKYIITCLLSVSLIFCFSPKSFSAFRIKNKHVEVATVTQNSRGLLHVKEEVSGIFGHIKQYTDGWSLLPRRRIDAKRANEVLVLGIFSLLIPFVGTVLAFINIAVGLHFVGKRHKSHGKAIAGVLLSALAIIGLTLLIILAS